MAVMLRVRTVFTYGDGGPGLNTMYFSPGTPAGSNADAADVCARVRAFFDAIKATFPVTFTALTSGAADAVDSVTGALVGQFSGGSPALVTGTAAGSQQGAAVMVLLQLRTSTVVNGRLLRGRQYLGPVATGSIATGGTVSSGTTTLIDGAASALLALTPTLSQPVVWHRPGGAGAGVAVGITDYTVWNKFAVLRSRRDG